MEQFKWEGEEKMCVSLCDWEREREEWKETNRDRERRKKVDGRKWGKEEELCFGTFFHLKYRHFFATFFLPLCPPFILSITISLSFRDFEKETEREREERERNREREREGGRERTSPSEFLANSALLLSPRFALSFQDFLSLTSFSLLCLPHFEKLPLFFRSLFYLNR